MPHLIFQIDEILRVIAGYIGQIDRPAAVEFACCCRAFEEPTLRPLWEDTTVGNLVHVLPSDILYFGGPEIRMVGSLSRYSSIRLSSEAKITFHAEHPPSTHSNRTL